MTDVNIELTRDDLLLLFDLVCSFSDYRGTTEDRLEMVKRLDTIKPKLRQMILESVQR